MSRFFPATEEERKAWRREVHLAIQKARQTGKVAIRVLPPEIQAVKPVFECRHCGCLVMTHLAIGNYWAPQVFKVCSRCGRGPATRAASSREWSLAGFRGLKDFEDCPLTGFGQALGSGAEPNNDKSVPCGVNDRGPPSGGPEWGAFRPTHAFARF